MTDPAGRRFLGLISGTSADGIDAAIIHLRDDTLTVEKTLAWIWQDDLGETLATALATPAALTLPLLAELDGRLGDAFAAAANTLLAQAALGPADITAIGCHGQTVWHAPHGTPPMTLQVGDGARIAAATGITVVNDFRRADMAAGGEGAPLAPLLHAAVLTHPERRRAIVNLGGIANVTLLANGNVQGFDTGPANVLMDGWARHTGTGAFDQDGLMARSGSTDPGLLARCLADPYFQRQPPKSTGREYFNPAWLTAQLAASDAALAPADVMATLAELTAVTVADAIEQGLAAVDEVILCGGGARNSYLSERLAARLSSATVLPSDRLGLDADFVEASLFAWLAARRIDERCIDTRSITGARTRILAGAVHRPCGDSNDRYGTGNDRPGHGHGHGHGHES
ncbi:MAG: anhydro-N-acetylmuramic acid kinase [Pseudomonadota bacterium]